MKAVIVNDHCSFGYTLTYSPFLLSSAVYCCYCETIILLLLWKPLTALGSCKNLDVVIVMFNLRRGLDLTPTPMHPFLSHLWLSSLIEAQKAPKIMPNEICRSLF